MQRYTIEKIMFAPILLFDCWQPENPLTWATKGILQFIVVTTWLICVVSWLGPLTSFFEIVIGSWRQMQRRRNQDW